MKVIKVSENVFRVKIKVNSTTIPGETGPQGPQGETGSQGPKGDIGPQGIQGEEGLSAYELAVQEGFVGTESEWIDFVEANGQAAQDAAIAAENSASNAGTSATLSEAWAEGTEPGGVGTKSSKEWATVSQEKVDTTISKFTDKKTSPNLFNVDDLRDGKLLNNSGNISSASGWGCSDWIPVTALEDYTITGERGRGGVAFFVNYGDTNCIVGSYEGTLQVPLTVTAPATANYVVINLYSSSAPNFNNVQIELGDSPSIYRDFGFYYEVKNSSIPFKQEDKFIFTFGETNYITRIINGNTLINEIRILPNDPNPTEIGLTYFNDILVRNTPDDAAPYRIDGGTVGANHDGGIGNINKVTKIFVDDTNVTGLLGSFSVKNELKVIEYYDIEGQTTSGIVCTVSMTYVFDRYGGETIYTDILGIQSVDLRDIMFVMGNAFEGSYKMYIPKTLPLTHESINYDFSEITDMSSFSPSTRLPITPSDAVATGIFVDRTVILKDGLGLAIGYLPIQDAEIARRRIVATRKALELNTNAKIYMSAIDSASLSTLDVDDYYSVVAYKNYFTYSNENIKSYVVNSKLGDYYYLDFHANFTGRIQLPSQIIGLTMSVIEKSATLTIHSQENTGSMYIESTGITYAVLKFS